MRKRTGNLTRIAIATISAMSLTFSGLLVSQSVAVSAPKAAVVEYASTLTINGVPYVVEPRTNAVVPATASSSLVPFPSTGYHTLTRTNPSWNFGDSNGNGYEQVSYSTNTEQWGYIISPAVQAIITGNASENADLYHGSTRTPFGQHSEGANYVFHGSSGGVVHGLPTYAVTMVITFRCSVGVNCTGRIDARWTWLMQ